MRRVASVAWVLVAFTVLVAALPVAAAPEGQMTWAIHVSLAPTWFEPAETSAMTGVGPRVDESGIGLVAGYAFFSAPYEDVKLKK